MSHKHYSLGILAMMIPLASSGCQGTGAPTTDRAATLRSSIGASRGTDTTSILEKLTKQVTIGSTVDAKNGDRNPRAIAVVPKNWHRVLAKGQLLACNFEDAAGKAGDGTTLELLDP